MSEYTLLIIVTVVGFFALAAALLVPVWKFLRREEQFNQETDGFLRDELARRRARRLRDGNHDQDDGGIAEPVG